jgi:hypothetical protein
MGKWGPKPDKDRRPPVLKRRGEVSGVSDVIDGFLADKGLFKRGKERVVALVWAEIVGPWFGRQTSVTKAERGVVYVHCDTAAVAQELSLRKSDIIARLNERLGTNLVKEVRASSGGLRRERTDGRPGETPPEVAPSAEELEIVALSQEERARLDLVSGEIEDPELRLRYRSVAEKAVKLQRWKTLNGYATCTGCGVLLKGGFQGFCTACWAQMLPEEKAEIVAAASPPTAKGPKRAKRLGS